MNGQERGRWSNFCPSCGRRYYVFDRDIYKSKMTRFADPDGHAHHTCTAEEIPLQSPIPGSSPSAVQVMLL